MVEAQRDTALQAPLRLFVATDLGQIKGEALKTPLRLLSKFRCYKVSLMLHMGH